jgi:hypothetical protein
MKMFKNFDEFEICNPTFNDCPVYTFNEFGERNPKALENLMITMEVVQAIRTHLDYPLKLTSTWRPNGRKGSSHYNGNAVDFQPIDNKQNWGHRVFEFLQNFKDNLPVGIDRLAAFWEWKQFSKTYGWIHIDTNFERKNKDPFQLYIAYENKDRTKMIYEPYTDKSPMNMVQN